MGLLRHLPSGRTCTLTARSVVGRSPACAVRADDPRVSSEHAVLAWTDAGWAVRDLGSRNQTTVDDRPLAAGEERRVVAGARIRFGGDPWELCDDAAPAPQAVALADDARITASGPVLLLPDAEAPLASVVRGPDGQ